MAVLVTITKWLGYVAALPVGLCGFMLSVGLDPGGMHDVSLVEFFIGMLLVTFAVTSFVPHRTLLKNRMVASAAVTVFGAPLVIVLCLIVHGVLTYKDPGAAVGWADYIAILWPAPMSFVLSWARGLRGAR